MADGSWLSAFLLYCLLSGRKDGRSFYVPVKEQADRKLLPAKCPFDLQEYLQDYAGGETKAEGEKVIKEQLSVISNEKVKEKTIEYLQKIKEGQRDFRF